MFFCSSWKALKLALCVLLLWRTKAQSSWQHLDYFDKIIFLPEPSREERSPFDNVVTHPSTWPCCIIILWASSLMIRPWNHTCVLWITEKHGKFFTHTDRHNHIIYRFVNVFILLMVLLLGQCHMRVPVLREDGCRGLGLPKTFIRWLLFYKHHIYR